VHDHTTRMIAPREPRAASPGMTRRDVLGLATVALGALIALVLAIPGVAYLLSPLRRKGRDGAFFTLGRLSQLQVGVPRSDAILEERQDGWVKYPREPVGSVWLIRQPAGSDPLVITFQSECPHLGCAINVAVDGKGFLCPCHTSAFTFDGTPTNSVSPRPMDRLEVELTPGNDPEVRVRFQRFRTAAQEKTPLA
jgi:menaquinol-cytochrome c reductase iron-sulfur subunit